MHLLHIAGGFIFGVGFDDTAVGMILGVVFRRAYVNASIATGTLARFGGCR
jgi:hypothetical protein